jgi:Tfp pilus assembly protein PilN
MVLLRNSTGIEIGESDLVIATVRGTFGKMRLMNIHRLAGFMAGGEPERKQAIKNLLKKHRVPTSRVYLTLPREQGIVRQIELPADVRAKLPGIVKIQVETLSPWPVAEIYWDFSVEAPKKDQKLVIVTIVIIPRVHLDPWVAFFKSVGLPLSGAAPASVAHAHGIRALWKETTPTIVLRRETSYTEGIVVQGNHLAALTAPSGEDGAVPMSLVSRLLSVAKLPSTEGTRLISCGQLPVVVEENPRLPIENAKPDATRDFGSISAALFALIPSAFKVNLLPPELRYRESQMRLIPALALLFVAILMGAALLSREPYQNTVYASQLNGEIKKIAPKVKEVADQEKELDQLTQRHKVLTSQLQNHDYVLETVVELARVLPPSAFLANYSYQDGALTVSGFAQSASEIQSVLENSPVFKGVEFTTGVARDPSGKDRFTLKMALEAK